MPEEATLVVIKPDGIQRSLTGNVLSMLSEARLRIVAAKITKVSRQLAEAHYQHMREHPLFDQIVRFIMGEYHVDRVLALVYRGEGAIEKVRRLCGATNPEEARHDSIRGKYGRISTKGHFENVLHASDGPEAAEREIKLWFLPGEIVESLYPTTIRQEPQQAIVWA